MSDFTPIHRLKMYKEALFFYKLSRWLPSKWFDTEGGFCIYFARTYGWYDAHMTIENTLPELYRCRPDNDDVYWFPEGELKPRIDALRKAISYLIENILLEED